MVKVRVFIENRLLNFDDDVFVDMSLPSIPRFGEMLFLNDDSYNNLRAEIIVTDISQKYNYLLDENNNFDVYGAIFVSSIKYEQDKDYVSIELSNKIIKK